ncbi:MAG: GIY-YIG nuclease family protein [Selenomonadaceae bacterium]|nr:GIY-YIG nuclease family protein [Selenomonadaceae bacterium]
MENKVQLFEHEKFGKVRVVIIDEKIHFVAADVCKILELKNPSDILKRLDEDEKKKVLESCVVVDPVLNIGASEREVNIVNEPGLYRLIFSSRKKEAREFQRWVYHEVLPSIRKTALYSIEQIVEQFLKSATSALPVQMCVYALEMNNVTVKIGITSNFFKRKRNIETGSGLTVVRYFNTHYINEKYARLIESLCHGIFSPYKLEGEFFSVEFEEACKAIDSFVKMVSVPAIDFDFERGRKIFKLTKKNIVERTNLIADKNP